MKVGHANDADLAQVVELRSRALLQFAPQFYNPVEVENLLADYDADGFISMIAERRFFCCRRNGYLCGTSSWDGDRLRHLYVEPECFGQGIGTALLEHTVADLWTRTESQERAWDGSKCYMMRRDIRAPAPC